MTLRKQNSCKNETIGDNYKYFDNYCSTFPVCHLVYTVSDWTLNEFWRNLTIPAFRKKYKVHDESTGKGAQLLSLNYFIYIITGYLRLGPQIIWSRAHTEQQSKGIDKTGDTVQSSSHYFLLTWQFASDNERFQQISYLHFFNSFSTQTIYFFIPDSARLYVQYRNFS